MLQRRMGMMWTSSGCDVSVSPCANLRTARTCRLNLVSDGIKRLSISDPWLSHDRRRVRVVCRAFSPAAHHPSQPDRRVEDRIDPDDTSELVPADRREPGGRDASAVRAVRRAAKLAWRDLRLEVGGDR